jgi:hypothetical protein
MTILTHIVDHDGRCARCGLEFPPVQHEGAPARRPIGFGDRIGVISGLSTPDSAYLITSAAHDSNALCTPQQRPLTSVLRSLTSAV